MTIRKMVSSVFKNHKLFSSISIVTKTCRFKVVHFLPIFGLWNRDHVTGRPETRYAYSVFLHPSRVQISSFYVQPFCTYKRINNCLRQKWTFFVGFRVTKLRSRDFGSAKSPYTNMTLLIIAILYPKFNFLCLAVF